MNNLAKFILSLSLLAFTFTSCLDEDFDQPPTDGVDPGLTVTTTIAELKAMHTMGETTPITEDLVIKGVVVADDFSGNLYNQFVLQDETAGIFVNIELRNSYFYYPTGREVYIKLQGMALQDYNNLIQIGQINPDNGQFDNIRDITDNILPGVKREVPAPKVMTVSEFNLDDVGRLITLENVIFTELGATYADPITQDSENRILEECDGMSTIVRSSGFAEFAGETVAEGGGNLTGILSIYNFNDLELSDYQIIIRDLNDVDMAGPRCGSGGNPCEGDDPLVVTALEEDFQSGTDGEAVGLTGWVNVAVKGFRSWQFKEFDGNVYVQATAYNDTAEEMETWLVTPFIDMDEAKTLTFESAQAFHNHDGLSVWVSKDFECDPVEATWLPIDATLAGSSDPNYDFVPSGDVDLSGLVGEKIVIGFKYVGSGPGGQTTSAIIDNIKIGEGGGVDPVDPCEGYVPVEVDEVNENFNSGGDNDPVEINGWFNVAATGTRTWQFKVFDGNVYCQATAYNDAAPEMDTWLVTPLINIDGPKTMTFESAKAFWTHNGMSVWVSTDFVCDIDAATWEPLSATLAGQNDADHAWIPSGDIDLSDYIGSKIAIAFRYEGNNSAGETASYRIDNLVIE